MHPRARKVLAAVNICTGDFLHECDSIVLDSGRSREGLSEGSVGVFSGEEFLRTILQSTNWENFPLKCFGNRETDCTSHLCMQMAGQPEAASGNAATEALNVKPIQSRGF